MFRSSLRFGTLPPSTLPQADVSHEDFGAPAHIQARLDSYARFGTANMAFADTDDPNSPKGLPMGRPVGSSITARPTPVPAQPAELAAENEGARTDSAVAAESALMKAKVLIGVALKDAEASLENERTALDQIRHHDRTTAQREIGRLTAELYQTRRAMGLVETQIDLLIAAIVRAETTIENAEHQKTITIITGVIHYIIDKIPNAKKLYGDVIREIAEKLKIELTGRYKLAPAKLKAKEKIVIDLDRTPLELFNNLSWEEICKLCGFNPRDYQEEWFQRILLMAKNGFDRGYVGAPTQTGKTFACFPIAVALAAALYPEKTIVFVVKESIVKQDMIDTMKRIIQTVRTNLREMGKADLGDVKIGVIDGDHKDFGAGYDLVIASLGTISREEHLGKINPDNFGIVATDECVSLFTNQGQRVLRHFGFVDENKNITPVKTRFLYGMSADAGIYDFSSLFGPTGRADNMDLMWYIGRKNLHEPIGLDLEYKGLKDDTKWTVTSLGSKESEAIPSDVLKAIENIYDIWVNVFDRGKIIVPWTRITYAEAAEAYFNLREQGSAYAYHSKKETSVARREAWVKFTEGNGVKVMHATNGLSVGARGKGVVGMVFPWQTNSLRRYGQWVGRMMGLHDDEQAAQKLIVQMTGWRGVKDGKPIVTLARYLGLEGFEPMVGEKYRPLIIKSSGVKEALPTKFEAHFTDDTVAAPEFTEIPEGKSVVASPKRFPKLISDALDELFGGDLDAMALAIRLDKKQLENFRHGHMPKEFGVVKRLAREISPGLPGLVISAWLEDFLEIWQAGFPLADWPKSGSVVSLTRLLRRESLMAGFDENGAAFSSGHTLEPDQAAALKKLLRGEYVGDLGEIVIEDWLPLVTGILKATKDLDQTVVDETLAGAEEEVKTLSKDRQDKEDERERRRQERLARGLSAADTDANDDKPVTAPAAIKSNESAAHTGEISTRRKVRLYYDLNTKLIYLRLHPQLRIVLEKTLFITHIGQLILAPSENLDAVLSVGKRRQALTAALAERGLELGMNTHGWEKPGDRVSDEEVFALFDRKVEELGLPEALQAKLKDQGCIEIGEIYTREIYLEKGESQVVSDSLKTKFDLDDWREARAMIDDYNWQPTTERARLEAEFQHRQTETERANRVIFYGELENQQGLSKRLDELDFSPINALTLQSAGIEYVWQLITITESELRKMKKPNGSHYFSRKAVSEINELLFELNGLTLDEFGNFKNRRLVALYQHRLARFNAGATEPETDLAAESDTTQQPFIPNLDLDEPLTPEQRALWAKFDSNFADNPLLHVFPPHILNDISTLKWATTLPTLIGDLTGFDYFRESFTIGRESKHHSKIMARAVLDKLIEIGVMTENGPSLENWERPEKRAVKRVLAAVKSGMAPLAEDVEIVKSLVNTRVYDLHLTIQCANHLRSLGIEYVSQLVEMTRGTQLEGRNFGIISLATLTEVLDQVGLSFGMKDIIHQILNPAVENPDIKRQKQNEFINRPIDELGLSGKSAEALKENDITHVWQFAHLTDAQFLGMPETNKHILKELKLHLSDVGLNFGTKIKIQSHDKTEIMTPEEARDADENGLDASMNWNLRHRLHDFDFHVATAIALQNAGFHNAAALAEKTEDELRELLKPQPKIGPVLISRIVNEVKKGLYLRGLTLGTKIKAHVSRGSWRDYITHEPV